MNTTTIHQNLLRLAMTLLMVVMTCASAWASDAIVTGFTATSGTAGTGENENYAKLVDGDRTTKWCITKFSSCYIEFEADEAFIPTAYILTTGDDNANSKRHGRNPKDWVLKAKTNKHDSWVTIASVTGDNVLQDVNTTDYEFSIANSGIYRYFRLEVSAVKSGSTFQLGELRFRGHSPKESELADVTLDERIQYITDVKLIGGSQSEVNSLVNDYTLKGWLVNEQNLNEGAGGDVIYLLYKMGSVASANQSFITDIYLTTVSNSENTPGSLDYDNRHYTLASYDGSNDFKTYKGNLNNGVGGGDQIHLYYTTENYNDHKAISSIIFNRTQSGAVGKNGSTTGYNLNNKGHLIYMHCPRNYAPQWIIEKSTDGGRCIIKGFEEPSDGVEKSAIKAFPSTVWGVPVVGVATSLNYKDFPNLETIYLYEKPLSSVMIPMNGCKKLQHVYPVDIYGTVIYRDELPTSITSIPKEGFSGCSALKSINIHDKVTNIGELAFNGCTGLTSLIIPNSVTSIGELAFNGCTGLTSFTIPGSVTSISDGAFSGCTGLTSVTIKDGVKSIGQGAFNGCINLKILTIPGSVTSIEPNTFKEYTFLRIVNIEDGVKSIGDEAFSGCTALISINFPKSVTSIGDDVFSGCNGLKTIIVDKKNPTYKSDDGVLFDKTGTILIVYPTAKAIADYCIPDGVERIGQGAFRACTSLKRITFPASLTSIGNNYFADCNNLAEIHVNNENPKYKSIDGVLLDKEGTTILSFPAAYPTQNYVIPDGVKNIGKVFNGHTNLTSITIPGSVTSISDGAFTGCKSLKSVTIEDGVTSIGQEAFEGCSSLKSVTIPGSVTSIGQNAFYRCISMTSVTIKNGVKSIEPNAFRHCKSLESVTIEDGVTSIGQEAFYGCETLKSITIPGSVTSIGQYAFNSCTSLTNISIPGSVTSIGQGAFYDCDNLASVSIMGNPKMGLDAIPDKATVTLSLTANAANGAKWMTFYNDRYNFQADENTTVYKATVSGQSLVLTEVADKIVNGAEWSWDKITAPGTAVILKSTGNPMMTRTMAKSSDTQANALLGTMEATATPANTYTLASGSKGVGFYRYTGSKVAAGKAYLIYSGTSAAREFIGFDEGGDATGISTITVPATLEGNGSAWYGLDGRKLQGEPTRKGIYMRNGRKVVIK